MYKILITRGIVDGEAVLPGEQVWMRNAIGPEAGQPAVFETADDAMPYLNGAKEINFEAQLVPVQ